MFDQPGLPSGEIGGDQRTARNAEHVRHYIAPVRTIEDHVADQRDRLDQRVHRQIGIACRPEGVHPSIIPDIGVIATVSPRLKLLTCRLGFTSQTKTNSCVHTWCSICWPVGWLPVRPSGQAETALVESD